MSPSSEIWNKVLEILREKDILTETTIRTWLSDVECVVCTDTELVLITSDAFKRNIIVRRYLPYIQKALYELFSQDFTVHVLLPEERDEFFSGRANLLTDTNEYTFERFVVGGSNKFAHAAAMAVADDPGHIYNPLFLYGESGLGKTHLLFSIAHRVRENHPEMRIIYVKGEEFTNEIIQAIRSGKTPEFREKYRQADMLLMDDVQFIAGKESTQEEFFHTFNALHETGHQIVMTSDRPPKDLLRLEDRLRTRFESGLLADIQPPDYETRLAIIQSKALRLGMDLPVPILEVIAENITTNVRQLEGSIKKMLAYRQLMEDDLNTDTATRAIKDILKDQNSLLPSAELIINETAAFYGLEPEDIRGPNRSKNIVLARHVAMYLMRKLTKLSLAEMGKEFNNRDHTTVMSGVARIETEAKGDPNLTEALRDITMNINAHNV